MPNGHLCKLFFTIAVEAKIATIHIKRDTIAKAETEHEKEAVSSMVRFLRRVADLIEAENACFGAVVDESGRLMGDFGYRA